LGSRLNGIVERVYVDVGDRVRTGDVLAQLQARHLEADVHEAQAEIGGLETTIEVERQAIELERKQLVQQRAESQANVDVAEAQARAARVDLDEATRAYELRESLHSNDGAVSIEDVRAADSVRRGAQARLDEAQANAVAARSARDRVLLADEALTIREQRIGVLEADLLRAQARLARTEADLEGTVIRAPEDGAILRRIVQPGGSVEVGQPILSMWLGRDLWVDAWIDEEDIGAVRIGSAATVTFHSLGGREFEGLVDKIGLATDLEIPESEVPQPRGERMRGAPVVGVRIRLIDPPVELLPGLSATVAIEKGE
jgi:multidrug resistance efflux pump